MPPSLKSAARADWLIVAALAALAVLARLVGLHQKTGDMVIFEAWYHQLSAAGGWRGLSKEIGNYNAPFLYLLTLTLYLPGALMVKIKAVWMIFDVLLAFFTYKIVELRWPGRRMPVAAALIMLFVPTIVINASFYGQMDSMWASFALGGVYFLLRGRYWWGVSLCTVALAFKPQGVFIFALVGLLILAGRIPWRSLLAVPLVYVGLDIPAIVLGRNPIELLTIYSMSRQESHVPSLTSRAPSVYAFIGASADRVDAIKHLGYVFVVALVLGICYVLVVRKVELTKERIVTAAALFSILVPFFLPGMHERYFFLADVMSVVLVFYQPRLWYVPLLVQSSSLLAYQPYLFHGQNSLILPLPIAASLMLAAMLVVAYDLLRDAVLPRADSEEADEEAAKDPAATAILVEPPQNGQRQASPANGKAIGTLAT